MLRHPQCNRYKYHYCYKITNLVNGHFYYGIHSTNNLNDSYMGSGKVLRTAMNIYGRENFKKEIVQMFRTREEASEYEHRIVTDELVRSHACYNVKIGGDSGEYFGTRMARDAASGEFKRCYEDDDRLRTGEFVYATKGMVNAKTQNGKYAMVPVQEYYSHKEQYKTPMAGYVTCKNSEGETRSLPQGDPRLLSGEFVPLWKGRKHSEETKSKISAIHKANGHQTGTKNSQYGKCWVTKGKENRSIKKEELDVYLADGWRKGRYFSTEVFKRPAQDVIDWESASALLKQGFGVYTVANRLNICPTTLYRLIKRHKSNFP